MRKIKFRVWDTARKIFRKGDYSLGVESGMVRGKYGEKFEDMIVNQFTGLIDKNGKEVYEGDIMKGAHDFGPGGFSERVFCVGFDDKNGGYRWNYWDTKTLEIIGNIYENPELLEDK